MSHAGPRRMQAIRSHPFSYKISQRYLAHVIVLRQMQKFMCYCTVFALIYFEFWGTSQALPKGLYLAVTITCEGNLTYLLPKPSTEVLRKSTYYKAVSLRNSLDNSTRAISSKSLFKNSLIRRTSCE